MIKAVLLNFVAIFILNWLLPVIHYNNWVVLLIISVVLAILNATLKPMLQLLFLPLNIITLGIFGWIINGAVLGLALFVVPGVSLQPLTLLGVQLGLVLSLMLLAFLISAIKQLIDTVL
ncbi:phage holin family protein [Patescibacteria group bacterium]|nr:phage holin family protein [Patescibacteria group bacterium]